MVKKIDNKTGLFSLLGGKWTIYRRMGEETVEKVIQYLKGI